MYLLRGSAVFRRRWRSRTRVLQWCLSDVQAAIQGTIFVLITHSTPSPSLRQQRLCLRNALSNHSWIWILAWWSAWCMGWRIDEEVEMWRYMIIITWLIANRILQRWACNWSPILNRRRTIISRYKKEVWPFLILNLNLSSQERYMIFRFSLMPDTKSRICCLLR